MVSVERILSEMRQEDGNAPVLANQYRGLVIDQFRCDGTLSPAFNVIGKNR